jgi:AcrR family transcriptional regulator
MPDSTPSPGRRSGAETRSQAERIALHLFSTQGYEATSLQQIADELGIKKASLYYHFKSKDDIIRSVLQARSDEAHALVDWVRAQPRSPSLAQQTVLRWIDSFSIQKLRGIRFMNANPILVRTIAERTGIDIGDDLSDLFALLLPPEADAERKLLLAMSFMTISSAVAAAADAPSISDEQIIAVARIAAGTLTDALR